MKIEFIIPSFKQPNSLMTILYCLLCQTNKNWSAHVIADGFYEEYEEIKNHFKKHKKVRFSQIDGPNKDWGHTPRNYGLKNLQEEWVVMTGQDNYYAPAFVENFLTAAKEKDVHFVYCDMIHNHYQWTLMKSKPVVCNIDIGNFMSKSEYASQMQIDTKSYVGDGLFVEQYLKKFPGKIIYIPSALYVHN